MFHAVVTAALLATTPSLGVPYVPQSDAWCGGAAAAMVFRYWGDARAGVDQFASLVEHRPGGAAGIATDVLVRAVQARGWRTEHTDPTIDALRSRIERRQPIIVLIEDRPRLYHYVVVVGADAEAIYVHDPTWGPSRRMPVAKFARLWAAARHWSLVVIPSETRADEELGPQPEVAAPQSPCDVLLA